MLEGLGSAGLTGLAVLPETIRHPFGVRGPILGPDDYRGALLRSLPSKGTMVRAAADRRWDSGPADTKATIGRGRWVT